MLKESDYLKIRVSVPLESAENLRQAMAKAGAGQQGNYSHCSTSYLTLGRFFPEKGAKPAIGQVGKLETVKEEVIEMLCHKKYIEKVIEAIKKSHPYEEPAIDIIPRLEIKDEKNL